MVLINLFGLHKGFDGYSKVAHGEVISYDWCELEEEVTSHYGKVEQDEASLDFIIAPNVWIWCDIFANFCEKPLLSEVLLGRASSEIVDMDTADALLNHILLKYGLSCDESALSSITQKLLDVEKMSNFGEGEL